MFLDVFPSIHGSIGDGLLLGLPGITKDLSTWAGKITVKHPEKICAASASRPNGQVAQVGPFIIGPAQTSMS